jgi:hypothetical protein
VRNNRNRRNMGAIRSIGRRDAIDPRQAKFTLTSKTGTISQ